MTKVKQAVQEIPKFMKDTLSTVLDQVKTTLEKEGSWTLFAYAMFEDKEGSKTLALIPCIHSVENGDDVSMFADYIRFAVRKTSEDKALKPLGVIVAMEAWAMEMDKTEVDNYQRGDIAKSPKKKEIIVLSLDTPGDFQTFSYDMIRNGKSVTVSTTPNEMSTVPGAQTQSKFKGLLA